MFKIIVIKNIPESGEGTQTLELETPDNFSQIINNFAKTSSPLLTDDDGELLEVKIIKLK